MDIKNGAAHVEFRILDDGDIGIIEIGARMGGDFIGTDLTPISTGFDYIKMVIDVACGYKPSFDCKRNLSKAKVMVKFILNQEDIIEYERIKKEKPESIVRSGNFDLDFTNEVIDSSTRHGYYILKDI